MEATFQRRTRPRALAEVTAAVALPMGSGVPQPRLQKMRIVAQDPSVRVDGRILTAVVDVPAEELAAGPRGYRVHVVDYDSSSSRLYPPLAYGPYDASSADWRQNPVAEVDEAAITRDPRFHAQNVYAVVMRTLARFEFALGRRVSWGFDSPGHQIKVAPHAFADANAFYSRRDEALLFGYFPSRDGKRTVFTCLSHDVVAHETSHAILDGLRKRFMEPSSPDQAAFHEGFADVVALLSVFALPEVVRSLIDLHLGVRDRGGPSSRALEAKDVRRERLAQSVLLGLAEEFGREMGPTGRSALRHSAVIPPGDYLELPEYQEPHRRGEILVSAVMNAFLSVWADRLAALVADSSIRRVDRARAAEEGSSIAEYLLTMAIRGLDYCPPVHLEFGTYLSAMLTADREIRPVDVKYRFREHLLEAFGAFGISHASKSVAGAPQQEPEWQRPAAPFSYDRTRFESMQRDADEVFRFVWENRRQLRLYEGAYTRVLSVRPCVRVAPEDGFALRETVAEVLQQLAISAGELETYGIRKPAGMPDDTEIMLLGGVTLVFDEYGRVKFAIGDGVFDEGRPALQERQSARLQSLWDRGFFRKGAGAARRFAAIHRNRSIDAITLAQEQW